MDHKESKLLRLNLQHFADGGQGEGNPTESQPESDANTNPEGSQGESHTEGETGKNTNEGYQNTINMTQEEFNKVIEDRLARERKKQEGKQQKERDESERKRLEENEEYKELAGNLQKQLDEQKKQSLDTKKTALLAQAGYTEKQVDYLKDTVKGESDDDMKSSIDELKEIIEPKTVTYGDPSAGNTTRNKPEKRDAEEIGASAFERIKGKLRR